jgi:ComF family protein
MKAVKYWNGLEACQPGALDQVYRFCDRALARVFPPRCLLCLDPGQAPALDLCTECQSDLVRDLPSCTGCAKRLPRPDTFLCGECLVRPRAFDAAFAPYLYRHPMDWMIHRMKYAGEIAAARVLGMLLGQLVRSSHVVHVEALLPVPLHRVREARRGYNQAIEIARYAGRELGLPVVFDASCRTRDTVSQAGLDAAERRHNLRGAFALTRRPEFERVAIIDDVLTTGSTVEELARVLKGAGVGWVEVWAVARA